MKMMKIIFSYCLFVLSITSNSVFAETWSLSADLWASPRTAQSVSKMESVKHAVQSWQNDTQSKISILYPGGEEGVLWSNELKGWMISLGVPEQSMQVRSGSGVVDQIEISIIGNQENI
jgi:hypothetical protein